MKTPVSQNNIKKTLVFIFATCLVLQQTNCGFGDGSEVKGDSSLINQDAWVPVEGELLHLFPPKTEAHLCQEEGYKAEFLGGSYVFSVLSHFCNYIIVHQEILEEIKKGDTVKIRFWHSQLTAPFDTIAVTSVVLDEEEIWQAEFEIPLLESKISKSEWTAPKDFPAGTPIYFHVNNHGNNEYSIVEIMLIPKS